MRKVKLGIIGLGKRGRYLLNLILDMFEDVEVLAVCDEYEDRAQEMCEQVEKRRNIKPFCTTKYDEVLEIDEINAVMVTTAWEGHIPVASAAMRKGKYTAIEVGGAYSVSDCQRLVNIYEETHTPLMMLENCCFGKRELMLLKMSREGVFGKISHCMGAYAHDLREEVTTGLEKRHYRLRNYTHRNCDNYPTHALGPIAKILNINRGNRFVSLVSVASKAQGLHEYIKENMPENKELLETQFAQGDVITTIIKCAGGETITLTLDTSLPHPYSRGLNIRGTRGSYCEENDSVLIDKIHNQTEADTVYWSKNWGNADKYFEKYKPLLWEKYGDKAANAGHDGMDFMSLSAFFDSVQNESEPPINVYDAVSWMSISVLSENSVAMGGAPVAIPDFTSGKWVKNNECKNKSDFSL